MSLYSRERKKRIRDFHRVRRLDEKVENWYLNQVHFIPEYVEDKAEFDFWACNGKDVFLITVQNSTEYFKEIKKGHQETQ